MITAGPFDEVQLEMKSIGKERWTSSSRVCVHNLIRDMIAFVDLIAQCADSKLIEVEISYEVLP